MIPMGLKTNLFSHVVLTKNPFRRIINVNWPGCRWGDSVLCNNCRDCPCCPECPIRHKKQNQIYLNLYRTWHIKLWIVCEKPTNGSSMPKVKSKDWVQRRQSYKEQTWIWFWFSHVGAFGRGGGSTLNIA